MRISILIPSFNSSNFIGNCLSSVRLVSNVDFEILICDASTDGTKDIIASFKDLPIKLVSQKKPGPFWARYSLLSEAKGDYVVFLDSDDALLPVFFEKIVPCLLSTNCDLFVFDYYEMSAEGDVICRKGIYKGVFEDGLSNSDKLSQLLLISDDYNDLWNKILRRSLFSDFINTPPKKVVNWGEDKMILLSISDKIEKVFYLPEPLYFYRINEFGATKNYKASYVGDFIELSNFSLSKIQKSSKKIDSFKLYFLFYSRRLYDIISKMSKMKISFKDYKTLSKQIQCSVSYAFFKTNYANFVFEIPSPKQKIIFRLFIKRRFWIIRFLSFVHNLF